MEISVTFADQSSTKESLRILKKIGEGKFNVYHAYSSSQKTNYALKAFPKNIFGANQYNKEILMSNLSHTNVIRQIPITACDNTSFYAILIEFAKYGDFFELVVGGVLDTEILMRTYFHQLVAGLEYIHSQGVAHLDLKLENLMMGSNFTLKIIDFDQSQRLTDKRLTSGGTTGFRAPEVIDETCRNLSAADIYSLGVILYAFKAQEYPFAEIPSQDKNGIASLKYYSTFIRNNASFWGMKATLKIDNGFFSKDFKELINGMLDYEVDKRFTLKDIKESKWFNGPILEGTNLIAEMKTRWTSFSQKNN